MEVIRINFNKNLPYIMPRAILLIYLKLLHRLPVIVNVLLYEESIKCWPRKRRKICSLRAPGLHTS